MMAVMSEPAHIGAQARDELKELFFRLLETDRESPRFIPLYEEFHRRVGLALAEGQKDPAGTGVGQAPGVDTAAPL